MPRPKGMHTESNANLFYLWAIVLAFFICGLVALNIALSSVSHAATRCVSPEFALTDLKSNFPTLKITPLKGDSAKRFMKAYNDELPKTKHKWTEQIVVHHDKAAKAVIFFFQNGCFVYKDTMNAEYVMKFMGVKKVNGTNV